MRAVELCEAGASLEETLRELAALRYVMRQVFTVDDLMSLRRGGRISGMTAVLGAVLHVKPILFGNEEGRIVMAGRVRGRKTSIRALAEDFAAHAVAPSEQTVGIAHAGCAVDAARLAGLLREKAPGVEILIVNYEPVTGSHVGPGALALFYRGSSREMLRVGNT